MRISTVLSSLAALVLHFVLSPCAGAVDIKFHHVTIEDGLSQGSILAIHQDSRGFLWFGTEEGLNRYDGYTFVHFMVKPHDPNSLSNNLVWAIHEDTQGNLWAGTLGGLNKFDREKEIFVRFLHDPADPSGLSHNAVYAVREDRDGILWVATGGGGVNILDRETGMFLHYRHNPEDPNSLSHDFVYDILEDRSGTLWFATAGGLDAFDKTTGAFTRYLSHDNVRTVIEDRAGSFWVGTNGEGVFVLDVETGGFVRYRHDPGDPGSLAHDSVYSLRQDSEGFVWIGTMEGLSRFNPAEKNFQNFRHDGNDPNSLSYDYVTSVFEDRTGVLWVGTRGRGLDKFVREKWKFRHFYDIPAVTTSLGFNVIRSFAEDDQGNIWVGTQGGGVDYFDRTTGVFTHHRHRRGVPNSLNDDSVYSIVLDRKGILWIGTLSGGLNRLDPKTMSFRHYLHDPRDPDSLSHNSIRTIYQDADGRLWIGTDGGGVNRFDPQAGKFFHYRNGSDVEGGLSHDFVRAFHMDGQGILWIGTYGGGLNRLNLKTGSVVHYRHDTGNPQSLSNDFIMSIFEDAEGFLWIGTNGGGVNRFDKRTGTFEALTVDDGLPNNSIYGILGDDAGNLWMTSNRGLSKLDPRTGTVRNFDVSDGLQSNEFMGGAAFKSGTGEMFFGGLNGFNVFHPSEIMDNPYPPQVAITGFQIFNKPVPIGEEVEKAVVLEKSIVETATLRLTHRHSVIALEFAALHFAVPEKNRYAYMMEGFEKDWNDAGNRRFVNYTNLPAGEYVFRVKAANSDGVWNEDGAALGIKVVPPFWKMWFFQGAVLLLAFLGATVAVLKRTSAIRARSRELEERIDERTAELQKRQKHIETILTNAPNAIIAADSRFRVTEWSPGAEKMFGYSREEALGRMTDDLVVLPEHKAEAESVSRQTAQGKAVELLEAVRYRRDGTPIHVVISSSPIFIGNEFVGIMAVYTDVTELVQARREAQEMSRAKSEFLANMSHEIRTPMNGIFGMTELALETDLSPDQREYMEAVKASAESLMDIINDILDFSKIEARKIEIDRANLRLRDTVHAIVSSLSFQADQKGLELAYHIPPDIPDRVMGDAGRLRQVLINLLGNAVKFTAAGEVVLTVAEESRREDMIALRFSVRDTGIGIPSDKLEDIFDPFSQVDGSTSRDYGGTGLGLAIAKQLVELLGGRIWAESKPGEGSVFHFTADFPLQKGKQEDYLPVELEDIRGLPVLVVDDNATNRRILKEMLTNWNMDPTLAESATQALDILLEKRARTFRILLIDANMPGMNGFDLAREIQARPELGDVLIMMLSSAGFRGDTARCRQLGISAYLTKPVKQSFLLDAIMLVMGTKPGMRPETPLVTRSTVQQSRKRYAILLVEDNVINQKLALWVLEKHGHRVTVAGDGLEALKAVEKEPFDCILMDVQMPRIDGFQATAMIRKNEAGTGRHVPIIAMTAHVMKGDREKCLEAGMDDYIAKPLKPFDMLRKIERIAGRSRRKAKG